jgi:hypothetical protein
LFLGPVVRFGWVATDGSGRDNQFFEHAVSVSIPRLRKRKNSREKRKGMKIYVRERLS